MRDSGLDDQGSIAGQTGKGSDLHAEDTTSEDD